MENMNFSKLSLSILKDMAKDAGINHYHHLSKDKLCIMLRNPKSFTLDGINQIYMEKINEQINMKCINFNNNQELKNGELYDLIINIVKNGFYLPKTGKRREGFWVLSYFNSYMLTHPIYSYVSFTYFNGKKYNLCITYDYLYPNNCYKPLLEIIEV